MLRLRSLNSFLPFFALALLLPQIVCAGSFKVGSINLSPVDETKRFLPFTTYLAGQLQPMKINKVEMVVAESIPAMAAFFRNKQVDLFIDSVFPVMAVSRLCGSKLLLRRWKMGTSEYRPIIFTRKDSVIARLADLKGKIIAFEEPFSSSGYFFPKLELLKMNFKLAARQQSSDPVQADEVGYIFSHGDSSTIFMVLNGVVMAGAIDDQTYLLFTKNLDRFRIIHETVPVPRQLVSYRADLSAKLVARVKEVLLGMHQTGPGRKVLRDFEDTAKFDEIPVQDLKLTEGLIKHIDAELKLKR